MRRRGFLKLTASLFLAGCTDRSSSGRGAWQCWGTPGTRDGSFVRPRAIAVNEAEVFVIDTTGRVQVFTEDGQFLRLWNLPEFQNGTPTGITFPTGDRIVIADTHYSRILEYTRDAQLAHQWGAYGSGPDQFIYPTDAECDAAGNYYISEYGQDAERIHVFDRDRQFIRQWGAAGSATGSFNRVMALALAPDGRLYVADTANHRVQCFQCDGTFVRTIGADTADTSMKYPHDLALAPDGTLLVAEYGAHRVSRYRSDGALLAAYGEPGRGPGQLHGPRGVAVSPADQVFVADTDNHRIQSFFLEGPA
ncbi:MAG: SMP-30/gluconolactonase/LRE family protein [Candidatus Hydrogenedentes bacterium]|nr:SMP-30/gluconolactonase/LRE family protein [Candidatus Hydrogenedentota bacterium]